MENMYRILVNGNVVAAFVRQEQAENTLANFRKVGGRDCMLLLDPDVPLEGFVVDTVWEGSPPGTTRVYVSYSEAAAVRAEFLDSGKKGMSGKCVFAQVRHLSLEDLSCVRRDDEGDLMSNAFSAERVAYGTW